MPGILGALKDRSQERYHYADITAYVGRNGSGKTLMAVNDLMPTLKGIRWKCEDETHYHTKIGLTEGYRNILSTVKLLNPATRNMHSLCVPYMAHRLFLVAEHSDLFLDEITAIYPSRGYGSLPNDVAVKLNQLRKPDDKVIWTAPSWQRADTILREVTEQVVTSRRFGAKMLPGRMRKTYSNFLVRQLDGDAWKQWINFNQKLKLKPVSYELYRRPDDASKGYTAQDYYNTFSDAFIPAQESSAGTCMYCAGRKSAPTCKCTPQQREEDLIIAAQEYWKNQMHPEEGKSVEIDLAWLT